MTCAKCDDFTDEDPEVVDNHALTCSGVKIRMQVCPAHPHHGRVLVMPPLWSSTGEPIDLMVVNLLLQGDAPEPVLIDLELN